MKRLLSYLAENTWTWVGTGLVLITLSGPTLRQAMLLSGIAVLVHAITSLGIVKEDNE